MFIDFLLVVLLVNALFKGYTKGLIVALFSSAAIFIGIIAATKLSAMVGNYLKANETLNNAWLPFLSFALVMIGVIFLVRLLAKMVQKTAEYALLGWVNKVGGILLFAIIYTTLLSVCIFYLEKVQLISQATIQASVSYTYIQSWGPKAVDAIGYVIPVFKNLFVQLNDFFSAVGKNQL